MLYNRKEKERDSLVLNWNKPLSKTKGGPNSPNQDLRKTLHRKNRRRVLQRYPYYDTLPRNWRAEPSFT